MSGTGQKVCVWGVVVGGGGWLGGCEPILVVRLAQAEQMVLLYYLVNILNECSPHVFVTAILQEDDGV